MSAPDTSLKKQRKRHIGPLIGIAAVLLFALVIGSVWLTEEAVEEPSPAEAATGAAETPPAAEGGEAVDSQGAEGRTPAGQAPAADPPAATVTPASPAQTD